MATYFVAAEYCESPGVVNKTSGVVRDSRIDPDSDFFLKGIAEKIALAYGWPAEQTLITCVTVLKP